MKYEIKPLADRVVTIPIKDGDTKTQGGIIIPEDKRDRDKKGKVISVGPKVKEVNVGDIVLYGQFAGTEVDVDKVTHRIMNESDIYAVIG